ncbi:MAG: DUF1801 domain-containing protein [Myxococcales bacterium]|nr:DUF1801 domain-containing protein [Myxococcales bacterium]MCB9598486.1 DUF1801 domain-containing protein [Sandaracinaceae bacterium]MCB9733290.1 DUF1801 domain-containing protein [Deltaproteobacteria bacterium]
MDGIFRFAAAAPHAPEVDAYLAGLREHLRPLATTWFGVMRAAGDDVRELLHDGFPTACVGDAAFGYVAAFSEHVNVGFFFGATLPDPRRLLVGTGKRMRHVKLYPWREPENAALRALVTAAYDDMRARLGA